MHDIHQENAVVSETQMSMVNVGSSGTVVFPTSKCVSNSVIELSGKHNLPLHHTQKPTVSNLKHPHNSVCDMPTLSNFGYHVNEDCGKISSKQNFNSTAHQTNEVFKSKSTKTKIRPVFGHENTTKMTELKGSYPVVYIGDSYISDMQAYHRMRYQKNNHSFMSESVTPSHINDADKFITAKQVGTNQPFDYHLPAVCSSNESSKSTDAEKFITAKQVGTNQPFNYHLPAVGSSNESSKSTDAEKFITAKQVGTNQPFNYHLPAVGSSNESSKSTDADKFITAKQVGTNQPFNYHLPAVGSSNESSKSTDADKFITAKQVGTNQLFDYHLPAVGSSNEGSKSTDADKFITAKQVGTNQPFNYHLPAVGSSNESSKSTDADKFITAKQVGTNQPFDYHLPAVGSSNESSKSAALPFLQTSAHNYSNIPIKFVDNFNTPNTTALLTVPNTVVSKKDNYNISDTMKSFLNENSDENNVHYVKKSVQCFNSNHPSNSVPEFSSVSMVNPNIRCSLPIPLFASESRDSSKTFEKVIHIAKPKMLETSSAGQPTMKSVKQHFDSIFGSKYSVVIPPTTATSNIDSKLCTTVKSKTTDALSNKGNATELTSSSTSYVQPNVSVAQVKWFEKNTMSSTKILQPTVVAPSVNTETAVKRKNINPCDEEPSSKNRKISQDSNQTVISTSTTVTTSAVTISNQETPAIHSTKTIPSRQKPGVLVRFEDGVELWIDKLRSLMYLDDEPVKSWDLKRGTEVAARYTDGLFYDAVVLSSNHGDCSGNVKNKQTLSAPTVQNVPSNSSPNSTVKKIVFDPVTCISKPVNNNEQCKTNSDTLNSEDKKIDLKAKPVTSTFKSIKINSGSSEQSRNFKFNATALARRKVNHYNPVKTKIQIKGKPVIKEDKKTVDVDGKKLKANAHCLPRVHIKKLKLNGDHKRCWGVKLLDGEEKLKASTVNKKDQSEKTKCPTCFLVFATAPLFEKHKLTVCGSEGIFVPDFKMEDNATVKVDESEVPPLVKNYPVTKLTQESDRIKVIPRGPDGRRCFRRGACILHRWQTEQGSKWFNGKILRVLQSSKGAKSEFEVEYTDDDHDTGPYAVTLYEDYPHDIRIVSR